MQCCLKFTGRSINSKTMYVSHFMKPANKNNNNNNKSDKSVLSPVFQHILRNKEVFQFCIVYSEASFILGSMLNACMNRDRHMRIHS